MALTLQCKSPVSIRPRRQLRSPEALHVFEMIVCESLSVHQTHHQLRMDSNYIPIVTGTSAGALNAALITQNTYRRAIDDYYAGKLNKEKIEYYLKVLGRVANRDSCDQFFNRFPDVREQYFLGREEVSNQDYLGIVNSYDGEYVTLTQKNYFKKGDEVEFISPNRGNTTNPMPIITTKPRVKNAKIIATTRDR